MGNHTQNERTDALKILSSTITKCKTVQLKFAKGTSQHSLLNNRIAALNTAKALLEKDSGTHHDSLADLKKALPPICSIIHKTEKAQMKYKADTNQYKRLSPLIQTMYLSKTYIEDEIKKQNAGEVNHEN